jgi:hypothetical protein
MFCMSIMLVIIGSGYGACPEEEVGKLNNNEKVIGGGSRQETVVAVEGIE